MSTGFKRLDASKQGRCCNGLASLALTLALLLPIPIHAAGTSSAKLLQRSSPERQPSKGALEELDEVTIVGSRSNSSIADWFRRMAGSYRDTGTLSYVGAGSPVAVWGTTNCSIFGNGPGLQCTLDLQSADGATNLNPGIFLFGFDLDRPRIRFMAVEDTGSSEGSIGELRGDTATFRAECVVAGRPCYRTTIITARPNSDEVRMEVAIEVRDTLSAHYEIVMVRLPGTGSAPQNSGAEDAPGDRNGKGPR